MAKLTEKELEYQRKWRAKRNADPELLKKHQDYQRSYQRIWLAKPANRENARKSKLVSYYKHRDKNVDRAHWYNVKRHYGITQEQYEQLLAAQGGGCALCGTVTQPSGKRLSIDHCHNSQLVRGILCEPCNVLLGSIETRPVDWLAKVQEYLVNNPAAKVFEAKCENPYPRGFNGASRWQTGT